MSFNNYGGEHNRTASLPDNYKEFAEEPSAPPVERIIALLFLLAALLIAAYYNADSFKFIADMPRRAYWNYVMKHTKEFAREYQFRRALPGKYVDKGRETVEIDPRATHIAVYYVNDDKHSMMEYIQEAEIDDLEMTDDGAYKMPLTIPKEAWQIIIYFTYIPWDGEVRRDYPYINYEIGTNNKLIYFRDVVRKGKVIPDKPQYNYLRTMKTYDAKGKETSTFAVGDKIYLKITDYSHNFPNGLDRTEFVADGTFSVYSHDPAVVSKKPHATEKTIVFDAVGKGEAEFIYFDPFCILNNWGKVTVK